MMVSVFVTFTLLFGYISYYLRKVVETPELICGEGPYKQYLKKNVPALNEKFWPTLWCFEARANTALAYFLRLMIFSPVQYRREILTFKDGGEVALDWSEENCSSTSPIILILPGLTGGSQAEYIRELIYAFRKNGLRCVVFNNRGIGLRLKTPRLYSAADYGDLSEVVDHIRKSHPDVALGAIGVSMGGLILGNYLASHGEAACEKIQAASLISVPWDTLLAARSVEKPYLNLMLNWQLASKLRTSVTKHYKRSEGTWFTNVDIQKLENSKTIREFDEHFTTVLFGYKDVDDYYTRATLHNKIHLIKVPLLCLSAADDFFQPLEGIPISECTKSLNVAILLTKRGGHIGFFEGFLPIRKEQYMNKVLSQFFSGLLQSKNFANKVVS